MKKAIYVTDDDLRKEIKDLDEVQWSNVKLLVAWLFILTVVVVILVVWAFLAESDLRGTKALLASQYNFTEDECAEWIPSPETTKYNEHGGYVCTEGSVTGMWLQIWANKNVNGEICYRCSLYCHTQQIPTGEQECKTEQKIIGKEIITCPEEKEGWNLCVHFITEDVTTCTPIYRNATTFCATPEQIANAMELVK